MQRPVFGALYAQCPLVDGTRAYAVGLVAAGPSRDESANRLPVPRTSLTSKLVQMLPTAVADTLTINEVRYSTVLNSTVRCRTVLYSMHAVCWFLGMIAQAQAPVSHACYCICFASAALPVAALSWARKGCTAGAHQ